MKKFITLSMALTMALCSLSYGAVAEKLTK